MNNETAWMSYSEDTGICVIDAWSKNATIIFPEPKTITGKEISRLHKYLSDPIIIQKRERIIRYCGSKILSK